MLWTYVMNKIIAVTLNHQPYIGDAWCAGSAIYCIIEVSDILNIIPRSEWDVIILRRITLYCRYNMIFMNIVMVPMMKSWHQDVMPQYYSAHCSLRWVILELFLRITSEHRILGSVPNMMIKLFWIMKIDPLHSPRKAFLFCLQV